MLRAYREKVLRSEHIRPGADCADNLGRALYYWRTAPAFSQRLGLLVAAFGRSIRPVRSCSRLVRYARLRDQDTLVDEEAVMWYPPQGPPPISIARTPDRVTAPNSKNGSGATKVAFPAGQSTGKVRL